MQKNKQLHNNAENENKHSNLKKEPIYHSFCIVDDALECF